MRIELECIRCGAKIVTRSIDEMSEWNKKHDETCVALHSEKSAE